MDDKKIKILYIAGSGRSGSTILHNILGQIDGFFSIGELRYVWERGFVKNKPCGCGRPFQECEFWKAVLGQTSGLLDQIDAYRLYRLTESFRIHHLPFTVIPNVRIRHLSRLSGYLEAIEKLYRAIQCVTDSRVIVDSSKNPAYGYLISHLSSIDLHILHFVRDARAVAYSWSKKKLFNPDPVNPDYMAQKGPLKSAFQWNARNAFTELLLRQAPEKYMQLKYEDFVQAPRQSVESILNFLCEPAMSLPFESDKSVRLKENHSVFGNLVRFQTGVVNIQLDKEWKSKMSSLNKAAVTLLTLPLLVKYGYLRSGNGETV
ncbi:MAG: sulfotransferase [Chloroflexota bacterium]|nr:MAG: sulfotransferase [Chloroflexota bacterium]